ncbi:Pentatricopeptide repeat-containing protein [Zostera marina]|uniref:Pentatricopeptide repeat-containing protein n=1 Tax=Zostera marina TaxID=29655 RepID=A0A0K9PIU2_ZOSMR|nr:Pentatricopeptide repeat-containing protein [Zostera marina]
MAHPRVLQLANQLQSCLENKTHHINGKLIHASIFRHGVSGDTFLSNRLIELYGKCNSPERATRIFDVMPHGTRNIFSWNAILSVHLKAGNFEIARHIFERMPERNVVSWNMAISGSFRSGSEEEALELCCAMVNHGFIPNRFTLATVLGACGILEDFERGTGFHCVAVKVGLDTNMFVENALVGMYSKSGGVRAAVKMFDIVSVPNEVTFTTMMSGFVHEGSISEALCLFAKMHRVGVGLDGVVISTVLGACSRMVVDEDKNDGIISSLEQIHALLLQYGFDSDVHVGNSLLDVYTKWGLMDKARLVFTTLPTAVNLVSCNVMIGGYGQRGDTTQVLNVLKLMEQGGIKHDDVTYINLVGMYSKTGDLITARRIFDKITEPNLNVWNSLLSGYCQQEEYEDSIKLFRTMRSSSSSSSSSSCMQPDRTTLTVVLSSCAGLGFLKLGKQVHAASLRLMLHDDVYVASGLVDMYSKCGRIRYARHVFDITPDRDIVNWNSMISGFALNSLSIEAFNLFKQMRYNSSTTGMVPTEYTFASLISSCSGSTSLAHGRETHALIEKTGFTKSVFVGSSTIDMYAKCGSIDDARRFFDTMPVKNIVSWNEMIHGYAQNGLGGKAVQLFETMLASNSNPKPDAVTFIAALTGCSHSGLVDQGLHIFNSMEADHSIKPYVDHYTCIIDGLSRAGRFEEVKSLLDEMPYRNDPIIWEVLLSSCRVHCNTELGRVAAEQLFILDPWNSAPYTLLASIYAASGKWADALAVRKLMGSRGVVKNRGYSWLDPKDGDSNDGGGGR